MKPALPYLFRWDRHGRKGEPCRIVTRSRRAPAGPRILPELAPIAPKNFNSILVEFADGFTMVTSGNAVRRSSNAKV